MPPDAQRQCPLQSPHRERHPPPTDQVKPGALAGRDPQRGVGETERKPAATPQSGPLGGCGRTGGLLPRVRARRSCVHGRHAAEDEHRRRRRRRSKPPLRRAQGASPVQPHLLLFLFLCREGSADPGRQVFPVHDQQSQGIAAHRLCGVELRREVDRLTISSKREI